MVKRQTITFKCRCKVNKNLDAKRRARNQLSQLHWTHADRKEACNQNKKNHSFRAIGILLCEALAMAYHSNTHNGGENMFANGIDFPLLVG